jgi:hypothetical protein
MQVLEKSGNKIIKMKFANIAYVLITTMTLVSFIKLIKEEYDRDMHTKTLVHVATEKKICDIEEHFGVMILEYNVINESTATVKKTASKINEVLIDQAPKEKEMEKTSQFITNSESIIHEKSDTKSHIMKINQSDERQQNLSLNNSHSSRLINSGSDEDHFIKASNMNDGRKGHFIKAPNMKNGGLKKHKKPLITNQKEVENSHRKTHHKDPNRTAKARWRPLTNGVQITFANGVKKRSSIEGFSGGQYGYSKHAHQGMQHTAELGQKRG